MIIMIRIKIISLQRLKQIHILTGWGIYIVFNNIDVKFTVFNTYII